MRGDSIPSRKSKSRTSGAKPAMHNPFTLWGSYAGATAGVIAAYFSFAIVMHLAETGRFSYASLLIPLTPVIAGFLIGWGLHEYAGRKR